MASELEYSSEGEEKATPEAEPPPEDMEPTERANLARYLTEEEQKKIAGKCVGNYDRDVASRGPRMKRLKDIQEMYALVAKQKNFPFHNCANIKTPTVTGPNLQIQARLYDMIWPPTGKIFSAVALNSGDLQTGHAAEKFANSYVRYKMPSMAQGLDDTLHQMCLYGSAFRRTYWDGYERKVCSDWIPIEDFVVAAYERSQDPSLSKVPRYTMVHHLSCHDIEDMAADGYFINADKVKDKPAQPDSPSEFKSATRKIDGQDPDADDEDAPRQVLEQHCVWKLPNEPGKHPAFDGKKHYVVITIDATSEQILRMSLREEDDPDDRRRFDREQARFDEYLNQLATYRAALEAYQMQQSATFAGPPGIIPAPMVQPAPLPPEPQPVPQPRPIRKRQICFFTHYRCFPSEGFYGLGYGDLLYGLGVALNTMLNQHLDGVSLKNSKPMFMSRQVRMQRGSVNVQPGEAIEVDGPINNIREAIMWLDPPDNDPTTVPLIKLVDGMKDSMVGNSDLMSGQSPGSNQTKVGMQILRDEMLAPITVLARRVKEAFRHELDKIWRCWGVFLEDEEIADVVNDETAQFEQIKVGRWMFSPTARLTPAADPRTKSQKLEDYQQLFGFIMQNPFIQQGPAAVPIMRTITEEAFRIFPDGERLIPMLPPVQPPGPPPPPPMKPQWAENAGFLRGEDSPINQNDDHEEHMRDLMDFLNNPPAQIMDKPGRDMAQKHLRAHQAALIEQRGAAIEQARQQINGPPGGGPPPMAGPPGIQAPNPVPGGGAGLIA